METLKEMFREVLQELLEAELDEKLGYDKYDVEIKTLKTGTNSRNGHSKKTIKTQLGNIELSIPRDRDGEFEPQDYSKASALREGKHCGEPFYGKNPKTEFCSPQCRNRFNVYKSRRK